MGDARAAGTNTSSVHDFVSPLQPFQPTLPLLYSPQHSESYRIVLKILLTIFATYSKIPKAIIIMN